jgi:tRNA(Ile)-lysidine synthase
VRGGKEDKVQNYPEFFSEPHKLLKINNTEPVLVALSGGADSSLLLHLLSDASRELGFPLYAAHVNHNIRTDKYGGEAARDESFCRELCEKLGVKLFALSADVPSIAKENGKSLETAAREARYAFFAEVMTEEGIKILATAHNADDNLETQIFNLARGCGIDGICGIPEIRDFSAVDGGKIVRPILSATKAEVIEYCSSHGFDFVTDSTNAEDDCTRNRIRHKIIPELIDLFGSPQRSAARLSRLARSDAEYLEATACEFLESSGGVIRLSDFNSLHPSISSRVISAAYGKVSSGNLEQTHVESILCLANARVAHSSISLPNRISAKIEREQLIFVKDEKPMAYGDYEQSLKLGMNIVANGNFAICVGEGTSVNELEATKAEYTYFASARLKLGDPNAIFARNRREGDTVRSGGMSKKVKKILCDKKIDVSIRNLIPLITDGSQIIYIPACSIADNAKSRDVEGTTLITIYQKKSEDFSNAPGC